MCHCIFCSSVEVFNSFSWSTPISSLCFTRLKTFFRTIPGMTSCFFAALDFCVFKLRLIGLELHKWSLDWNVFRFSTFQKRALNQFTLIFSIWCYPLPYFVFTAIITRFMTENQMFLPFVKRRFLAHRKSSLNVTLLLIPVWERVSNSNVEYS